MSSQCRSCQAPIQWVITERGVMMPLDADPQPDGNIILTVSGARALSTEAKQNAVLLAESTDQALTFYRSHFASCPFAKRHRKKKNL